MTFLLGVSSREFLNRDRISWSNLVLGVVRKLRHAKKQIILHPPTPLKRDVICERPLMKLHDQILLGSL